MRIKEIEGWKSSRGKIDAQKRGEDYRLVENKESEKQFD